MLLSFSFITDHQDSYSSMIFIVFSIYNLFTHTCYTVRKHKGTRFQSVFHITIIHQMQMQPQWNSGNWRDKPHRDLSPASAATELLASITFICTFIVQVFTFFFSFYPGREHQPAADTHISIREFKYPCQQRHFKLEIML